MSVEHLDVTYSVGGRSKFTAVSDLSLDILRGETLGLVGESGCGKSSFGKAVVRHVPISAGQVRLGGNDISRLRGRELRTVRGDLQMVFQDPVSSLNPRRSAEQIIGQGLDVWKKGTRAERAEKVREVMEAVGLPYQPEAKRRRHEFSGGQCQRISIARALVMEPEVLVCDEAVSALDVSVQAQILNMLLDLRERYELTMLFIAHNLAVVKYISDRIAVMYLGKLCEIGPSGPLTDKPRHPYTRALLDAANLEHGPGEVLESPTEVDVQGQGDRDTPDDLAARGCRFRDRCPSAQAICGTTEPEIRMIDDGHFVACHFPLGGATAPAAGTPGGQS
ncbi:ABC transporter ATP-binding protein [Nocardioides sp. Root190]|uniref:oligopeptide/dipeptide ABC transporter ATP-binding protein n=1 Tax=Nocardioides sp. Root190 TaxID=1736488 RepID=UPI001910E9E8|nr:ABC transporter ATP-binding protein [Nocardioides sp. Root190]